MKCPVCKNNFNEHTGRRPKRFCSDECKVKFWNAKKKVAVNNKPENKKKIENERNAEHNLGEKHENSQPLSENEVQIAAYEKELAGLGTSGLAVMRKKFLQKKISELENKAG